MVSRFKFVLCVALLCVGAMQAEDEAYYYGKLGTGFPDVVNVGVGRREFCGSDGYDVSLSAGYYSKIFMSNLKGLYLYRFSPDCPSSYYVGVGGGVNFFVMPDFHGGKTYIPFILPSLETSLGKSWTWDTGRRSFLQLALGVSIVPLIRLEYGISF